MAKAKSAPISEKIQASAEGLRHKAKSVRAHKGKFAENFVASFSAAGINATTHIMSGLELAQKGLGLYVHGCKAAGLLFAEIDRNPKLRTQIETMVSNIVDDVTARLNEFANIMDSVSKSSEIQEAFEELQEAAVNMQDLIMKSRSIARAKRTKRKE